MLQRPDGGEGGQFEGQGKIVLDPRNIWGKTEKADSLAKMVQGGGQFIELVVKGPAIARPQGAAKN